MRERVDVDAQGDAVVHRDRQRLGPAHPAEPGGQRDRAGQRAAEPPASDLGEALVRALEDPLGADVDPRPGRHLAVHRQPHRLQPAELGPVGPVGHQVGVGDQHPRRPLVGAEHTDRLARLDEHRLVVGQRPQRPQHGVERLPRPGGPAGAAVDDEVVGAFGDVGVEVVLEHPERRLLGPAPAAQLEAPGSADGAGAGGHPATVPHGRTGRGPTGGPPLGRRGRKLRSSSGDTPHRRRVRRRRRRLAGRARGRRPAGLRRHLPTRARRRRRSPGSAC